MNYHRCNLFKANGHVVGYAHVYLELGEDEEVDFTDLQLVLAGDQELLGVELTDVDPQLVEAKSVIRDGKSERYSIKETSEKVINDWTSEGVIGDGTPEMVIRDGTSERRSSEGEEAGQSDSSDEDVTFVDKSVDTAKECLGAELEDFSPPSSNFEQNIKAVKKESASPTSSSPELEDPNLPRSQTTFVRGGAIRTSVFEKYFSVTGLSTGNSRKKQIVECKLCREGGTVSRITRGSISKHMMYLHLPDEECEVCGKTVKPVDLPRHQIQCGSAKDL